MLPPPIKPMCTVMWPSVSVIGGDEILVGRFGGFGRKDCRRDQDAVAKGCAGAGSQEEIQFFPAIAEDFLTQRIGGEQAVTAGVPVSGEAGILRVIENGDGHRFVADPATEIAPAPARAPSGVAFPPFAGEISAVDAGVVQLSYRCG